MADVHAFTYRAPRLSIELPIELKLGPHSIPGQTRDISDTGMLVQLTEAVCVKSRGSVRLRFGACQFEIDALVVYTGFFEAGLSFCFSSDAESDFVKTLVRLLVKRTQSPTKLGSLGP